MFFFASAFNQPLSFDTSSVTDMSYMFVGANKLSAPNKLLIRCAWAGTAAFASAGYGSSWAPGSCTSSPSSPPPPPPPSSSSCIFTTKASLQTKVQEFIANPTAATATCGPIADWDVSAITDMSSLFKEDNDDYAYDDPGSDLKGFNADISGWDTSSVTDMNNMFFKMSDFNQLLSFDTSSVTDMNNMFNRASAFNQPLSFDTSSVTDMSRMFFWASAFNQQLSLDTSSVTTMRYMFFAASAFNQPLSFDTSSVTDMNYMFQGAGSLSAANKLLIRCAWAGTAAFDSNARYLSGTWPSTGSCA